MIVDEVAHGRGEDRVALRRGTRFAPRLTRAAAPRPSQPLTLRPDGSYLVTGAFGGIGLALAEWLADRGARHLVLTGRRSPAEIRDASLDGRLQALRTRGVAVEALACDVADEDQMRKLLAEIAQREYPLRGVIHAAAALPFGALSEALPQEDLETAFRAKVEGARVLHRLTRGERSGSLCAVFFGRRFDHRFAECIALRRGE